MSVLWGKLVARQVPWVFCSQAGGRTEALPSGVLGLGYGRQSNTHNSSPQISVLSPNLVFYLPCFLGVMLCLKSC